MGYHNISAKRVITYFNNTIEQGGFWLPNVKRELAWKEEQIEKFVDSIMREYPIGSLLVLKTRKSIAHRRFVNTYSEGVNVNSSPEPRTEDQKLLVLDGQKRLQSLFIALNGSYNGKELYFNVLSGDKVNDRGLKYDFRFMKEAEKENYWIKLKHVISSDKKPNVNRRNIINEIERETNEELTRELRNIVDDNLDKLINCFTIKEIICYAVLDDIADQGLYTSSDICDIVTNYNSMGSEFDRDELLKALS